MAILIQIPVNEIQITDVGLIVNPTFLLCPEKTGPLSQVRDRWLCP
jgi:hypothetical protein